MRSILSKALILIILASFLLSFHPAQASYVSESSKASIPNWSIQRADDVPFVSPEMGDHAAVYDASGNLHVVFGGDHLYYAKCVGTTCTIQTVDNSDSVGSQASLALDSQGYPHIAYHDAGLTIGSCNDWKLKYAKWTGSQWVIQVVDESCTGINPSIALDGTGKPHISYFNESWDELQLADWDGSYWNTYTPYWLPSYDLSGYHSSLLSDASGNLHLGFITNNGGNSFLQYTNNTSGSWFSPVAVDAQAGVINFAMVLNGTNPHFSYHIIYTENPNTHYKVRYNWISSGVVQTPTTLADMDYLGRTAITLGSDGYPRVAYQTGSAAGYIVKGAANWGAPTAIPNTDNINWMYLGKTSTGIGLTFNPGGAVKNSTIVTTTWSAPFTIEANEYLGASISLASAASGDLHISYTDNNYKQLKYARRTGGTWQVATLQTVTGVNQILATDIDLGPGDRPYIVYQENDASNYSVLKLTYWTGSLWAPPVVVSETYGCSPSMEVSSTGAIWIAYQRCDYSTNNLYLAIYNGAWQYQFVDTSSGTTEPSLMVNSNGHMYVAYVLLDYGTPTLRYAYKEDSVNWNISPVYSFSNGYIRNPSLAKDGSGKPRIAFTTSESYDHFAKFAYWTGTQWLVEPVSSLLNERYETSLVVDATNRPHMTFIADGLSYAVKEGSTWTVAEVDYPHLEADGWTVGPIYYVSMALNNLGKPVIAYNAEYDLKVAELSETWKLHLPMVRK